MTINIDLEKHIQAKLTMKESDVSATSWRHCQGKLNEVCDFKSILEFKVTNLHKLDKDLSANWV